MMPAFDRKNRDFFKNNTYSRYMLKQKSYTSYESRNRDKTMAIHMGQIDLKKKTPSLRKTRPVSSHASLRSTAVGSIELETFPENSFLVNLTKQKEASKKPLPEFIAGSPFLKRRQKSEAYPDILIRSRSFVDLKKE